MKQIISRLISRLKKEPYNVDPAITTIDLLSILFLKGMQVIRGIRRGLFFRKNKGLFFCGRRVVIRHAGHVKSNGLLTIEDGAKINALCREGITFGENVTIGPEVVIEGTGVLRNLGEGLTIGNNVGISQGSIISIRGKVKIGDDCIFGPNVSVHSENHIFDDIHVPIRLQGERREGVIIENDCWIGNGAIILDGVKIGRGTVVAAHAVVTNDVAPYSVIGGVPAKIISSRRVS